MSAPLLLAWGAALGVHIPRSLRPPIEEAAAKRERKRQKRIAKEAP